MSDQTENYLEINAITKKYGAVEALRGVSFSVRRGEIHTLLGENGAGKSTLVKIIMGETEPNSGSIRLEGKPIEVFNPRNSQQLGISMVHQELAVFENMTIAENIFPSSAFRTSAGFIDRKRLHRQTRKSLAVFELCLEPGQKLDTLSLAQQQMVEILRAISLQHKLLLLDEPTSGLDAAESQRLMRVLKKLRDDGITIIYISHRIREILEISDRVTVLRDGRDIGTYANNSALTADELISKMAGREYSARLFGNKRDKTVDTGDVLLEAKGLAKQKTSPPIDFKLFKGEVLGFFGLEGSGTNQLSRMMYGLEGMDHGELHFKGARVNAIIPSALLGLNIVYLSQNRKQAGLLLNMPATDNMSVPVLEKFSRLALLDVKGLRNHTNTYIRKFSIVISSLRTKPRQLSGGNQQKLMLSICLGTEPACMIVNEPTRGIDVGAKAEIHDFIMKIANNGVGVIVFSSDLPELLSISDRIIVMHDKKIAGELTWPNLDESLVMTLAAVGGERGDCA